jgi:protein-disulfide isomerase
MARYGAIFGAALVIAAGLMFWNGRAPSSGETLLAGMAVAQEADIDVSTIVEMEQGNPDAPVTVIEYASYTCPHCATFHKTAYKQLKTDYIDTGKIRFVYREVYFDRFGLWASMIARCGGADKFFGMTELIYDGQSNWARAGGPAEIVTELRKIGRLAGLSDETLDSCLQDGTKAQTLVTWYQQNAEEHGIDSTPSFIINGEKHSNMSFADMSAIIDEALGE